MRQSRISGKAIPSQIIDLRRRFREEFQPLAEQFHETALTMISNSGGDELIPAIDSGIVTLSHSGFNGELSDISEVMFGWLEILKELLLDPTTHLLFDDKTRSITQSLVAENQLEPNAVTMRHASEAAVGAGLVARLPALPDVPIDELMDLRQDLSGPLIRFRAAVARLADQLAFSVLDDDQRAIIDDAWRTEVQPAIDDIEEGFAEHTLVREFLRQLQTNFARFLTEGTAMYIGFGQFTTLNEWLTATAAAAGPTGDAMFGAFGARNTGRRELKKRDMFYLYEAHRRMS